MQVNDILSRYILVHDDVFKFSLRKVIPIPGIFKPIDYRANSLALTQLLIELADARTGITAALAAREPSKEFLAKLEAFAARLTETIGRLRNICDGLGQRSRGAGGSTATDHQRQVDEYNVSVQKYLALGGELNALFPR
jgi:hypothetical protein